MEKGTREECDDLLESAAITRRKPRRDPRTIWVTFLTHTACVLVTVLAIKFVNPVAQNLSLQSTSIYSPVLENMRIPLHNMKINASLWPSDHEGPWRGIPTEDAKDDPWDAFEHIRVIPLTAGQITKMGKKPEKVAKFDNAYWGLGDDAYIGADTGFLTYNWVETNDNPFPDFGVNRQCKDWRQLVEYRDKYAVDQEKWLAYPKPKNANVLPMPPEYWNLMKELNMTSVDHVH